MSGLGLTNYGSGLNSGRGMLLNSQSGINSGVNFKKARARVAQAAQQLQIDAKADSTLSGASQSDQKRRTANLTQEQLENQRQDQEARNYRPSTVNESEAKAKYKINAIKVLTKPALQQKSEGNKQPNRAPVAGQNQKPLTNPASLQQGTEREAKETGNILDPKKWPSLEESLRVPVVYDDPLLSNETQEERVADLANETLLLKTNVIRQSRKMTKSHEIKFKGIVDSELTIGNKTTTLSAIMRELNKILGAEGYLKGDLLTPSFAFDSADAPTMTLGTIELTYALNQEALAKAVEQVEKYFEISLDRGKGYSSLLKVSDKNQKISYLRINVCNKNDPEIEVGPFFDIHLLNESETSYNYAIFLVNGERDRLTGDYLRNIRVGHFSIDDIASNDLSTVLSQSMISLLQGGVVRFFKNQKKIYFSRVFSKWLTTTKTNQIVKMLQKHISLLPSDTAVMIDFFNWLSVIKNKNKFIDAWLQAAVKCDVDHDILHIVQDLSAYPELIDNLRNIVYGMLMICAGRNIAPFVFPWMEEVITQKASKPFTNFGFSINLNGSTHHLFMGYRNSPISVGLTLVDSCRAFHKSFERIAMKCTPRFAQQLSYRFSELLKSLGVNEELLPEESILCDSDSRQLIYKKGREFIQSQTFEVILEQNNRAVLSKLVRDIRRWCSDPEISLEEFSSDLLNFNFNFLLSKLELTQTDTTKLKEILPKRMREIESIILAKLQQESKEARSSLNNVLKQKLDIEIIGQSLVDIFPEVASEVAKCRTINAQKEDILALNKFFSEKPADKIAPHLDELIEIIDSLLLHLKNRGAIKQTILFYISLTKKFPHIVNNKKMIESVIKISENFASDSSGHFKADLAKLTYTALKNGMEWSEQSYSLLVQSNNAKQIAMAQGYLETVRDDADLFSKLAVQFITQAPNNLKWNSYKCILFLALKDNVDTSSCLDIVAEAACSLINTHDNKKLGYQTLELVFSKQKITKCSAIFGHLKSYIVSKNDHALYELEHLNHLFNELYGIDKTLFDQLPKTEMAALVKNLAIRLIEVSKIKSSRMQELNDKGFALLDKLKDCCSKEQLGNIIFCSMARVISKKCRIDIEGEYFTVIPLSSFKKFQALQHYLNSQDLNLLKRYSITRPEDRIQFLSAFFKEFQARFKGDQQVQVLQQQLKFESDEKLLNVYDTSDDFSKLFEPTSSIKQQKRLIINTLKKRSEQLRKDNATAQKLLALIDSWLDSDSIEKILAAREAFSLGVKEGIFKDNPERRSHALFKRIAFDLGAIGSQKVESQYRLNQTLRSKRMAKLLSDHQWRNLADRASKAIQTLLDNKDLGDSNERFALIKMIFTKILKNEKTRGNMNDLEFQRFNLSLHEMTIRIVQTAISEKQISSVKSYQEDLWNIFHQTAEINQVACDAFDLATKLNEGSIKVVEELRKEAARLLEEINSSPKDFTLLFKRFNLFIKHCSLHKEDKLFLETIELFAKILNSLPQEANYSMLAIDDCFISFCNYINAKQKDTFNNKWMYETQEKILNSIESFLKILAVKAQPFMKKRIEKLLLVVLRLDPKSLLENGMPAQISNLESLICEILKKTVSSSKDYVGAVLRLLTKVIEKCTNKTEERLFKKCLKLISHIQTKFSEKELHEAYENDYYLLTLDELNLALFSRLNYHELAVNHCVKNSNKFQQIATKNKSKEVARIINYLMVILETLPSYLEKLQKKETTVSSAQNDKLYASLEDLLQKLLKLVKEENNTNVKLPAFIDAMRSLFSSENFTSNKIWRPFINFLFHLQRIKQIDSKPALHALNFYCEKMLFHYFETYKGDFITLEQEMKLIGDEGVRHRVQSRILKNAKLRPSTYISIMEKENKRFADAVQPSKQRRVTPLDNQLIVDFPFICFINKEQSEELLLRVFKSIDITTDGENFEKLIESYYLTYPKESIEVLEFYLFEFITMKIFNSSDTLKENVGRAIAKMITYILEINKISYSKAEVQKKFLLLFDRIILKIFEKYECKNNAELYFLIKGMAELVNPRVFSPELAKQFVETVCEKILIFSRLLVYLEPKDVVYDINQASEVTKDMKDRLRLLITNANGWFTRELSEDAFDFVIKQIKSIPKEHFKGGTKEILLNNPPNITYYTMQAILELMKIYSIGCSNPNNKNSSTLNEMKAFYRKLFKLLTIPGEFAVKNLEKIRMTNVTFHQLMDHKVWRILLKQEEILRAEVIKELADPKNFSG